MMIDLHNLNSVLGSSPFFKIFYWKSYTAFFKIFYWKSYAAFFKIFYWKSYCLFSRFSIENRPSQFYTRHSHNSQFYKATNGYSTIHTCTPDFHRKIVSPFFKILHSKSARHSTPFFKILYWKIFGSKIWGGFFLPYKPCGALGTWKSQSGAHPAAEGRKLSFQLTPTWDL
jgi:hypothetical protein